MAQQDEGWPLGLQPLNARIELARSGNNSGSISFNTLATGSPSSSTDSSDLDTESTGSFYPDKSITLGSLMGVSSIGSLRGAKTEVFNIKKEKKFNFISWLFCSSSRGRNHEAKNKTNNVPSLGQYLAVERRTANENRRIQNPLMYGPDDEIALAETNSAEPNSLFVNGTIAPPQTRSISPKQRKGFGSLSEIFSCICGQAALG